MNAANLLSIGIGRALSLAILGLSFFLGGQNPSLFLWALLIEEVLTLASLSLRQAILTRGTGRRSPSPMALYAVFPLAHLVFVGVFTLIASGGLFAPEGAARVPAPSASRLLALAGAYAAWALLDSARWALRARSGKLSRDEAEAIDLEARMCLFLPHLTIIAGGFCLIMLRLGNWLAWGILAGKGLFELLSFSMAVSKARHSVKLHAEGAENGEFPREGAGRAEDAGVEGK